MKIVTWNMDYWRKRHFPDFEDPCWSLKDWIIKCREYLYSFINLDEPVFILLQEIDPYFLFELDHERAFPYRYSRKLSKNTLLVYYEIPSKANTYPWGNALILNKPYNDRYCSLEANKSETFCNRNSFMCNTFELLDGEIITILNFYNKINNGVYPMLDVDNNLFKIADDIKEVLNGNDNLIIFAGDFNVGSNNSDFMHINRYNKLCEYLPGFIDISNGSPEHNQNTTFWQGVFLINDFCFVNNLKYLKHYSVDIGNEWTGEEYNKKWKGLSDHCPIIIDFELN